MFNDLGTKMEKGVASTIMILSTLGGVYYLYKAIDADSSSRIHGKELAMQNLTMCVVCVLSGTLLAFVVATLGKMLNCLESIQRNTFNCGRCPGSGAASMPNVVQNRSSQTNGKSSLLAGTMNDYVNPSNNVWVCKKCSQPNPMNVIACKGCGEYK